MKKLFLPMIIGLLLTGCVVNVDSQNDNSSDSNNSQQSTFTLAEVAQHNNSGDCWTVINNEVYDITTYINFHPGGEGIKQACGIDSTQLFETQGGEGTHSEAARSQLKNYKIGVLE